MAGFNAFLKSNNIVTGTQIPTEGNYKTGDIVVNIGPNSAAEPMWICNEGGNPGVWGPVGVGGGSGSIVSINSSVLVSEPVHEVSLESLGVAVTKRDKLLVHYNSTHLLEGVHFEIIEEGTKIAKLGDVGEWNTEGLDNCIFAFELFKGVQNIDGNEITVASKMTCKTNHVIIENPCGEVEIGIEGFKSENDTLMVFKNGVIMVEGVDYTIEGDIITSTGEVWNQNGLPEYGITFVVFKEVVLYEGGNGTIKMDHLAEDVKEAIENASNIDLSGYANRVELEKIIDDKLFVEDTSVSYDFYTTNGECECESKNGYLHNIKLTGKTVIVDKDGNEVQEPTLETEFFTTNKFTITTAAKLIAKRSDFIIGDVVSLTVGDKFEINTSAKNTLITEPIHVRDDYREKTIQMQYDFAKYTCGVLGLDDDHKIVRSSVNFLKNYSNFIVTSACKYIVFLFRCDDGREVSNDTINEINPIITREYDTKNIEYELYSTPYKSDTIGKLNYYQVSRYIEKIKLRSSLVVNVSNNIKNEGMLAVNVYLFSNSSYTTDADIIETGSTTWMCNKLKCYASSTELGANMGIRLTQFSDTKRYCVTIQVPTSIAADLSSFKTWIDQAGIEVLVSRKTGLLGYLNQDISCKTYNEGTYVRITEDSENSLFNPEISFTVKDSWDAVMTVMKDKISALDAQCNELKQIIQSLQQTINQNTNNLNEE